MKHSINNSDSRITRQMFLKLYPTQFVALAVPYLSNLTGTLLIGNFLPQIALAAVGFTTPITAIISTFYRAITSGSDIFCGHALGLCDSDSMNRIFSVSMTLLLFLGIFFSVLGLSFAAPIASLLGATDEALTLTATYIRSLLLFFIISDYLLTHNIFPPKIVIS